jgi:hypothetical protein
MREHNTCLAPPIRPDLKKEKNKKTITKNSKGMDSFLILRRNKWCNSQQRMLEFFDNEQTVESYLPSSRRTNE